VNGIWYDLNSTNKEEAPVELGAEVPLSALTGNVFVMQRKDKAPLPVPQPEEFEPVEEYQMYTEPAPPRVLRVCPLVLEALVADALEEMPELHGEPKKVAEFLQADARSAGCSFHAVKRAMRKVASRAVVPRSSILREQTQNGPKMAGIPEGRARSRNRSTRPVGEKRWSRSESP